MKQYSELRGLVAGEGVDTEEEIRAKYRILFSSPLGREVLAHMLTELHFFDGIVESSEEIVLSNYAKVLLNRAGVWSSGNVREIVNSLMNITPKPI